MKKLTVFLVFVLMVLSYIPTHAQELPQTIKIGLFYGTAAKETINIQGTTEIKLYDSLTGTEPILAEDGITMTDTAVVSALNYTFSVSENKISATDGIETYIIEGDAILYPTESHIAVGNKKYRGHLELKVDKNGKLTVINVVKLEEYLYGVLPYEMSTGFPYEALKAQAVCARTYAINNIGKFKEYGFDLTDNTLSQVYNGINGEADDCTNAVIETKGMVVCYNGNIAETFYYASSSGETLDVKDVWGSTTYPYLISVPDTYQSVIYPDGYNWTVTYTKDEVTKIMNDKGFTLGTIEDITIDKTTPQGAVTSLTFVGERGSKTYTLGNTRNVLGLKSQVFDITRQYSGNEFNTFYVSSNGLVRSDNNDKYLISSNGIKKAEEMHVISSSGVSLLTPSAASSAVDKYIISGSGYGHGIGMSQNGAKGMAKSGFSYDEILTHYFPGCTIENRSPITYTTEETNSGEF